MEEAKKILFSLLRAALNENFEPDEKIKQSIPEHLEQLYSISKAHDIAHLVGYQLKAMGALPEGNEISAKFTKQQLMAIYRHEKIAYEQDRLFSLFEQERIPFIPLKGAVIRGYYPEAWMRTSCDIDILIKEADIEDALKSLEAKLSFFSSPDRGYHDVSVLLKSGVHLELHFTITENIDSIDKVLTKVWEYSYPKENGCNKYLQSNEFLFFHIIAHAAYHFICGGCGIRPFIDLWLMKNKLKADREKLNYLISEAHLDEFAVAVWQLVDVWFNGCSHTELTREMENYILSAGAYGTLENKITISQFKRGGKIKHVLSRLWVSKDALKFYFPTMKDKRWLIPFYQAKRWLRLLSDGRAKRSLNELKVNASISKDDNKSLTWLIEKLKL